MFNAERHQVIAGARHIASRVGLAVKGESIQLGTLAQIILNLKAESGVLTLQRGPGKLGLLLRITGREQERTNRNGYAEGVASVPTLTGHRCTTVQGVIDRLPSGHVGRTMLKVAIQASNAQIIGTAQGPRRKLATNSGMSLFFWRS